MAISEYMALGKEAGKIINKILEQIPNDEQRVLRKYFEMLDVYQSEISREDSDHDYLLTLRERKKALDEGFIGEIRKK